MDKKYQKIQVEEVLEKIDQRLLHADDQRLAGLEGLNRFRKAKAANLQREKQRLIKKVGPGDQRIARQAAKEKHNAIMTGSLEMEIQRAQTDLSGYDKDAWNIYGYVRDKELKALPNLTVGLFDEEGKWVRNLGYGGTDKRGQFSINYKPKTKGKAGKGIPVDKPLFIHVSDANHNVLYKDPEPLYFTIGQLVFRELKLKLDDIIGGLFVPPEPNIDETVLGPDEWVVKGWVRDENGCGLEGYTVSLFDKDFIFDDYLGTTVTGTGGAFMFIYQTVGFRDLFEKKPDIYLAVLDKDENKLFKSKKAVKSNAGRIEIFNVTIEGSSKTMKEFPAIQLPDEGDKK
ncbi:MAG: hypothetical protein GY757_56900 [bacterium]|nr:hypothetical protein [bacterium]